MVRWAAVAAAAWLGGPAVAADGPGIAGRLGVAAWTFRDVTFLEAIEKTAALGLTRIEAFQTQKLAPDSALTVGSELSAADVARVRAALDRHGLRLASIYVHSIPGDPAAARKIFERVQRLGAGMIVGEPAARALDVIEPLCTEFGIDLALHNHPDDASEYHDPEHLATVLAGRGPPAAACSWTRAWACSRASGRRPPAPVGTSPQALPFHKAPRADPVRNAP
jgi:hypothetical protein